MKNVSQVAELVDAPMNKGSNSQPEAMFTVRYYKYRFESCPDYANSRNAQRLSVLMGDIETL